MVSDSDLEELHAFAQALGVPRHAFQDHSHRNHPHYDIPSQLHELALERGAELVTGRELVTRMIRPPHPPHPPHPSHSQHPPPPQHPSPLFPTDPSRPRKPGQKFSEAKT